MIVQKSAKQEVTDYVEYIKSLKTDVFMGNNREDEVKYLLHNIDRFTATLEVVDDFIWQKGTIIHLLDIGTSPFTFILRKRYPQLRITTMDVSKRFYDRCRAENITHENVDLNKIKKLPTEKQYDIITFLEVLEHLESNHKKLFSWLGKILKDDSVCLVQTPNKYSFKAMFVRLLGIGFWDKFSDRPHCSDEFAHVKEYSLKELIQLISSLKKFIIYKADHALYFDTLNSSLVYRNNPSAIKPLLTFHYYLATLLPLFRGGLQVLFTKPTKDKPAQTWVSKDYHYGLPPTPVEDKVVKGAVKEISETVKKYLNQDPKTLTVLDAGSGRGEYAYEMSNYFKEVYGVDPYKPAYEYATQHYKRDNLKFINSKIEDFNTNKKFNVVTSLATFEHMSNQDAAFTSVFHLLKKGGFIYLTAPSKLWVFEQHYGLPFLSWLPLWIANHYLRLTRGVKSFEDCSYSKTYEGMKHFFEKFNCTFQFILPFDKNNAYLGCSKRKGRDVIIRNLGFKLLTISPVFWNLSKGFIMIITKR